MKSLPPRPARAVGPARFFGALAFAVLAEAALARRFDLVDGTTLMAALATVPVIAAVGIGCALVAFADVWRDGSPGLGRALGGFALSALALAPLAGAAGGALLFPPIDEVSTDLDDRPVFHARPPRPALPIETRAPVTDYADLQRSFYPDILPRSLPLSTVEAHAVVARTLAELGWTVTAEAEPASEDDTGTLDAEARSLLLGLPIDVAVRIAPDGAGSRIDVRSGSQMPMVDLGENARRIRAFFAKLDEVAKRPAAG
ncbi:DUF1499 domain-containing protein [Oharaeibacter diazotrophicus]|uniref:Uncharacterized protein DUF1499 n=1 Tax=Oharaeibacter diazotrophicus TaxID=1920512 RepID=A0A4R6RB41_9HYPH|nr:DUF1499 domain-containing protein [Oharaeibacter diazotrophicus]TDP83340.1 uncharacterized protein DUF1499 [Oharaeibacter diazotrophicus]BBE72173.1 hypothetical protein OHA_1_01762 [Pleomorphomonas sp. SM30]GLS78939.1 hypothetical protein GCM10007904_42760 [Oharaeibacter diazotrophicus]